MVSHLVDRGGKVDGDAGKSGREDPMAKLTIPGTKGEKLNGYLSQWVSIVSVKWSDGLIDRARK
jgi:hypothetical protein